MNRPRTRHGFAVGWYQKWYQKGQTRLLVPSARTIFPFRTSSKLMQRSAIVRRMFHRMVHCATLNDTLPVYSSSIAAESPSPSLPRLKFDVHYRRCLNLVDQICKSRLLINANDRFASIHAISAHSELFLTRYRLLSPLGLRDRAHCGGLECAAAMLLVLSVRR